MNDWLLGIDGGGTKTIAWLASAEAPDRILGCGRSGPSNQRATGPETALRNLDEAVDAAFADSGHGRCTVAAACLGLAGADRPSDRSVVEAWAREVRLAHRTVVVNDAVPLLHVDGAEGVGVALIAGTGSLAWGRNSAGHTARSGGWGYLLGDEGSALAIGRSVLMCVVRAFDGRGAATSLSQTVCSMLGLHAIPEIVPAVYGAEIPRAVIAELAPAAFAAADEGDRVAEEILQSESAELARMVKAVCDRLDLKTPDIIMAGSVLLAQAGYRGRVAAHLRHSGIDLGRILQAADAVAGAVRIALRTHQQHGSSGSH